MNIINLHNRGRFVYLFKRDKSGKLIIQKDNSFYPYFYEPNEEGNFIGYDGRKLRKVFCSIPKEVPKRRSPEAYEADIIFTKRYLIDKVDKLDKCPIKYAFIDIEVLTEELPNVEKAEYPVSCITVYNSWYDEYKTWFLGYYGKPNKENEKLLLNHFMDYMKEEKFDLWLSWNVDFDYNYLYNRIRRFPDKISPLGQGRYGKKGIFYPAGISIVDYLGWDKKVTLNKRKSYKLDDVAYEELKADCYENTDFGTLDEIIMLKNINDVKRMVALEKKLKYIPYFDEIRRLTKVEWEDMIWNSRIVDMLLLQEAKNQKQILPMKPKDLEKEDYEGAYREAYKLGAFENITKYDLSSAYPFAIIDFCLDPSNIIPKSMENHMKNLQPIKIENTYFEQDSQALLPTIVKKLIDLKTQIKLELDNTSSEAENYKDLKKKYNAIKSVVNSAYGVMGNRYFRLYDKRVASATTYLVREVLHYVRDKLEEQGYPVIYVDTDSVFIDCKENLTELLNNLVKEWAKTRYNKNTSIEFDYEGIFQRLLILAKCRYKGYIINKKGELEPETKGIEAKRKDSSKFMAEFQTKLMDKIMNKESREEITNWILDEIENIKTVPIEDIAFPCKLARPISDYKNTPIFVRALKNTNKLTEFNKKIGDIFYYIYTLPIKEKVYTNIYIDGDLYKVIGADISRKEVLENRLKEIDITGKKISVQHKKEAIDVLAFDKKEKNHVKDVDWKLMINRNIINKVQVIFEALNWNMDKIKRR